MQSQKSILPGGLKRGPRENNTRRFPDGGPKRGNPTATTSTITAKRNGNPQHHVEGKKVLSQFRSIQNNLKSIQQINQSIYEDS